MVRQLQDLGEEVAHVLLFDSVPPGCATPRRSALVELARLDTRRSGRERGARPTFGAGGQRRYRKVRPQRQERIAQLAAEERALGIVDVERLRQPLLVLLGELPTGTNSVGTTST